MMRIQTLAVVVYLTAAVTAFAATDGAWTASLDDRQPDRMHINLSRDRNQSTGMTMRLDSFAGISSAQAFAHATTPVQFQLRREAGTVTFDGSFRNGKGAGQFTFTGNPAYADAVRALGVEFELHRKRKHDDDETLLALALHDVSTDYIRTMQAEGFRTSLEKYLAMRIFKVTPEYVREMRSLGYSDLSADKLIGLRIHKVTPEYIREMRAAGWDLSLDQLQSSRIHRATPEFAAEMRKLGYGNLTHDDLVSFRIHKVTPEFISELRELGYDRLSASQLVSMRIHRVTPRFIREVKAAGYSGVPVEKLISMKIHRIDPKMLERMNGDR